jgi:hypothetical protein
MFRIALLVSCAASPCAAASTCRFDAYTDWGSQAPAIHAGPSADTPQIGIAPHTTAEGDDFVFGAYVTVTAMQNGWAHVTNVVDWNYEKSAPDGWIDGADIAFIAQTDVMFARADPASQVIWSGPDQPYAKALLDCDGQWAKITFTNEAAEDHTGWVRGICAIQETTCDGVRGDKLP